MTAAAIVPMIGLVGGAVDMGRLYAVKSRLQSACDAGALTGRRVMGTGRWTDNSNRANGAAEQTFDLNFQEGSFGSENRARAFTENDGTVTGTASANVPMTLMRVFGMATKNVAVTCEGMMRIPNTDVMFVLDNSGSMDETIPGDSTGLKKMAGLQRAIRCFYEALAKENISDVSPADCGATADPTEGLSSQVQLRFGFVNYDHMVNVGKLLPHDFMVDNWTYQSRVVSEFEDVWGWTLGTVTATTWGSWSSAPSGLSNAANYSGWGYVSGSGSVTVSGTSYSKTVSGKNSSTCPAMNTNNSGVAYSDTASVQSAALQSTSQDPPVYPATAQTLTYGQNDNHTASAYRYAWDSSNSQCRLQVATQTYTLTRTGTATKPITWTSYHTIKKWTYRPVQFDVSSLKGTGTTWNGSVSIPVGETRISIKPSGSSTSTYYKLLANTTATWAGCIEERKTFQNTDGNPSDDWLNFPASPTDAIDMDIDRVPSAADDDTRWRPALMAAVWGRKETLVDTTWSGTHTTAWVEGNAYTGTGTPGRNLSNNSCNVTPSRVLTSYNGRDGNPTAADFSSYVGTIAPAGNTYHDIGLLWGARLMSPTGIFAADNATTPGGAQITRHLIFMTDGDTATTNNNYDSYGMAIWDQRQFNTSATSTQLTNANNARANALCTAIKNKNITLWVISYGGGTSTTTNNRLKACATSTSYFFLAADTPSLITKFREIADRISNLRLTN